METFLLKKNSELIMTDTNDCIYDSNDIDLKILLKKVHQKVLKHELNVESVKRALRSKKCSPKVKMKKLTIFSSSGVVFDLLKSRFVQSLLCLLVIIIAIYYQRWDHFIASRCAIANNYFVMEITRPVTNCDICRNVTEFVILENENATKEQFAKHAYTGQPILVRGATNSWLALQTFNFDFFRRIYTEVVDAYQSVEEECQFFPFKTDFNRLSEVFSMPEERIRMSEPNSKPWYIGWSNCNPEIAQILRKHYKRPNFLPDDSESSAIDWIFMGYSERGGASMHLDYVQRPSWQAQISGSKTWHLLPPPECEKECTAINITVQKGDIILIDTNQWYHDTHVNPGQISITIGSEYD